jgi:hypothetical protein
MQISGSAFVTDECQWLCRLSVAYRDKTGTPAKFHFSGLLGFDWISAVDLKRSMAKIPDITMQGVPMNTETAIYVQCKGTPRLNKRVAALPIFLEFGSGTAVGSSIRITAKIIPSTPIMKKIEMAKNFCPFFIMAKIEPLLLDKEFYDQINCN